MVDFKKKNIKVQGYVFELKHKIRMIEQNILFLPVYGKQVQGSLYSHHDKSVLACRNCIKNSDGSAGTKNAHY